MLTLKKKQRAYSEWKDADFITGRYLKKVVDKNRILNLEKGLDMDPIWKTLMLSSER